MSYHIAHLHLANALDARIEQATGWNGIEDYLGRGERWVGVEAMPRDVALAILVDNANDAVSQLADTMSEEHREPNNGCITIDGDLLRVRFGSVPRSNPDAGYLAPELEPIPIRDIIIEK
jgi:hypothetical protein